MFCKTFYSELCVIHHKDFFFSRCQKCPLHLRIVYLRYGSPLFQAASVGTDKDFVRMEIFYKFRR